MPPSHLPGFENKVIVGIADMAVSNNPNIILTTYSLGSCIGIAVYDPVVRVGGLAHCMLPEASLDPAKGASNPAMFVDTALPALFRAACELKADARRVKIYLVGCAQIMDSTGFFNIGKRNYRAAIDLLTRNQIRVEAEHVGGFVNRTMNLSIATGGVSLKISGQAKDFVLCKN
jgi:chemotaxis protein CheD